MIQNEDGRHQMAPITEESLPKTVEQQTLIVLKSIERMLKEYIDDRDAPPMLNEDGSLMDITDVVTKIEPTKTPFIKQMGPHGKSAKVKKF